MHQSQDRADEDPEENLDDHGGRPQPGGDRRKQERGDPHDHQRAGAVHHWVPNTEAAASASAAVGTRQLLDRTVLVRPVGQFQDSRPVSDAVRNPGDPGHVLVVVGSRARHLLDLDAECAPHPVSHRLGGERPGPASRTGSTVSSSSIR